MDARRTTAPLSAAASAAAAAAAAAAQALLPEVRTVHAAAQRLFTLLGGERASEAQLRAIDLVVARLRARSVLHPHAFYPLGFGEPSALAVVARSIRWQQHALLRAAEPAVGAGAKAEAEAEARRAHEATVEVIAPRLVAADDLGRCADARGIARVHEGSFASPAQGLVMPAHCVPLSCLTARFQLITPLSWRRNAAGNAPLRGAESGAADAGADADLADVRQAQPVAILLAGTGEQSFARRRQLVSLPLARAGIASVILESPYYGSRRPPLQVASKLRTMVDLPLLGRMTIEEARALVRWLRARRGVSQFAGAESGAEADAGAGAADAADAHGAVVLAGVSMGGLHAAMTASLLPPAWRDVGVASWLGPPSGAAVFTRGALALGTDFAALARDVEDPMASLALEDGLCQLEALLYMRPGALTPAASAAENSGGGGADGGGFAVPRSAFPTRADTAALAAFFGGVRPGALEAAQRQAVRLLRLTDITNFAPPARPDAAVFVTGSADAYVPPHADTLDMWEHVRREWRGCDVRTLRGGHVTGSMFSIDAYVRTVAEVARKIIARR